MYVGQENHESRGSVLHALYQVVHAMICPITVDVNCDHQVKVISARFLHYNVTVFPFLISKCPVVKYFETM